MTGYQSKKDMAQDKLAQPAQEPVAFEYFKEWMAKEMPPMTTIGNPEWWAKRIYDRFINTHPPQRTEQELVCDKDPQSCWNVRCQLGKKCKNTPPAQPEQERNFCSRCGKRTADLTVIHTCTPPQEKT